VAYLGMWSQEPASPWIAARCKRSLTGHDRTLSGLCGDFWASPVMITASSKSLGPSLHHSQASSSAMHSTSRLQWRRHS
jgi:hypothetical protein